jgi:hypothetical protein
MLLSLDRWKLVSRNKTTFETLKTLYRRCHGDMTDIVDQQ